MDHGTLTSSGEEAVSRLLDTLLPGDRHFPPASSLGMAEVLRSRLRVDKGNLLDEFAREIGAAAGQETSDVLKRLEVERPQDFAAFLTVVYLTYYEADAVIAAINATGKDYHGAPQPRGYDLPRFRESDRPRTSGSFVATDEVRPVTVPPGLRSPV